tara:strand:- start:1710 stop:2630 length:921 start_codon:yes stop_codon:yes gene_type:complete
MTDVKKEIKKLRPNLKDNTIHQYSLQLTKLQKLFDTDDYKFLDNPKDVANKISHLHYTSQRNAYNAIILLLLAIEGDKELIEEYGKMRDELNNKYEEEQASGKISEKQSKNFVEMSEVENMVNEMGNTVKGYKKKESLNQNERQLLKAYTLFSILIRIPTRNDQAGMILISKKMYNKLKEEDKKAHNYLLMEKSSMKFIYNQYKTAKKYAENIVDIPKDLEKILRMYIRIMGIKSGDVLFDMTKNAQSQLLLKMSQKYMGKRISSTMIRKIYLSSKYGDTLKEMKEDAKIMGHSTDVAQSVYIKEK